MNKGKQRILNGIRSQEFCRGIDFTNLQRMALAVANFLPAACETPIASIKSGPDPQRCVSFLL